MKLLKLSEEHYIVVDDSEIKVGDWYYDTNDKESLMPIYQRSQDPKFYSGCKKITHSTNIDWHEVYYIPLSEVKELIGEVDVENKAEKLAILFHNSYEKLAPAFGYVTRMDTKVFDKNSANGKLMIAVCNEIYQAIEDNKEKKYTEEDMQWALYEARYRQEHSIEEIIQALQPKTEWEVEFVDGKLKLK